MDSNTIFFVWLYLHHILTDYTTQIAIAIKSGELSDIFFASYLPCRGIAIDNLATLVEDSYDNNWVT